MSITRTLKNIWIRYIAVLSVLLFTLSACSNATTSTPYTAQAQQPAKGGEFTYALATSPDTLDPEASGLAVAHRVIRAIFDSLVIQMPDNSIQPWLATKWMISPDGKTYTFQLRNDVKFQDGTPFNAEAVKFNLDRAVDPATKSRQAAGLLNVYKSSEVLDNYTIKVDLKAPYKGFLNNLSSGFLGMVSPTAVKKYGDQFGQNPVGTGPFKFVKWIENSEIDLVKNPDYHWGPNTAKNQGPAYLDKLTFKIIPEEATRIGSVQSGQVLAAETVPPQNIAMLKNDPNIQVYQTNTSGMPYVLFFNIDHSPWNELKARQALQSAIDVDSIVKTLYFGTYPRAWSALTPTMLGYDKSLENSIQPDLAKANRLLDELGWVRGTDGIRIKNGKKLTLHYVDGSPNREKRNDIAAMVQQQLKQIGVQVNVEITKNITSKLVNGDYDIYGNSIVTNDSDVLRRFFSSKNTVQNGGGNFAHLNDPNIDQLLTQAQLEQDSTKRAVLYSKVQQYLSDNAIIIPVYIFPYTVAVSKNAIGLQFDTLGYPFYNDVSVKN